MGPESRELRLELADELIAGGDAGLPYAVSSGYVFRYVALVEAGDIEGADAALARAHETARVPRGPLDRRACGPAPGWCSPAGSAEAEQEAIRATELAREGGFPQSVVTGTFASAMWCIRVASKAASPELQPLMMDRLERAPRSPGVDVRLRGDRGVRARQRHDAASAALGHVPSPEGSSMRRAAWAWPSSMIWAADVCEQVGHAEGAARLHELLSPLEGVMVSYAGPMSVSARPPRGDARPAGGGAAPLPRLRRAL